MALTRKFLSAMDIPAEKIDEIINAHSETVNSLKEERDKIQKEYDELKDQSGNADSLKKELEEAHAELDKIKTSGWESKYKELKAEYDSYKADTEAKATKSAKETAYKKLLIDAGVSSKRVDSILKVSASSIDSVVLDEDGKIKDADKIIEGVKEEWSDFISTSHEKGADVSTPPANNGSGDIKKPSRATELVAQYRNEHYGNPNKED